VAARFEVPVVSFLSDYGTLDEFVGVCHGVMLRIAPDVRIIDLTHEIAPHDTRAGGLALARAVQYVPEGVVLAIVDPGVGTDRRAVAVEVEGGFLVGPDNGVLAPAVAMLGGARRAVSLTNEAYQLPAPGPTFAGRDVFAPAAAHLVTGVDLADLGDDLDPALLQPGLLPLTHHGDGAVHAEVLWVDRFGNVQLNVDPEELAALGLGPGDIVGVRIGDAERSARWVRSYADAGPGELALLVDSYGLVCLALDRRSAAADTGLSPASAVTLSRGGDA
jgi:S-adenosylmethionine hydrolase